MLRECDHALFPGSRGVRVGLGIRAAEERLGSCPSSKPNPHGFIGGFGRLAIACGSLAQGQSLPSMLDEEIFRPVVPDEAAVVARAGSARARRLAL